MSWENEDEGKVKRWDIKSYQSFLGMASKSQTQGTLPQLNDCKTLNAATVLSGSWTLIQRCTQQKKFTKNKSLTPEYKKITAKSAYFGALSNFSANLIFAGEKLLLILD